MTERRGSGRAHCKVITMDIRRKLQQLEARIGRTFDRKVSQLVQARTREPLEIVHAVVERTAREVQSSGRGRRVFPFTALSLTVAAPSRDERARLEAVFDADPSLRARIVQRLRADGCAVESLELAVQFVPRAQKNWEQPQYHVEFIRSAEPAQPVHVVAAVVIDQTAATIPPSTAIATIIGQRRPARAVN